MPIEKSAAKQLDEIYAEQKRYEKAGLDLEQELAKRGTSKEEVFSRIADKFLSEIRDLKSAFAKLLKIDHALQTYKDGGANPDEKIKNLGRTIEELWYGVGVSFLKEMREQVSAALMSIWCDHALSAFRKGGFDIDQALEAIGESKAEIFFIIIRKCFEEVQNASCAIAKSQAIERLLKELDEREIDRDQGLQKLGTTERQLYWATGAGHLQEMEKQADPEAAELSYDLAILTFSENKIDPVQVLEVFGTSHEEILAGINARYVGLWSMQPIEPRKSQRESGVQQRRGPKLG